MSRHANKNEKEKENEYEEKQMRRLASALALIKWQQVYLQAAEVHAPKGRVESASAETEKDRSRRVPGSWKDRGQQRCCKGSLIIATANETPSMTTHLHNATAGDYLNTMTHDRLFSTGDDLSPQPPCARATKS